MAKQFRSVRELSAADGKSSGHVALSESIAPRAGEYPLHPVLLDGALHVFSAGRSTVEARGSQLKLPVRFGRISISAFPRSLGARRASVSNATMSLSKDVSLFMTNPANRVFWWTGSAPSVSPGCAGVRSAASAMFSIM